jgi:hypothetical protein
MMDFDDVTRQQLEVLNSEKDEIEYIFFHYGKWRTYYQIYPSYAKVLLEAIKPRYWKGHSVILMRRKLKPVTPGKFDSYT